MVLLDFLLFVFLICVVAFLYYSLTTLDKNINTVEEDFQEYKYQKSIEAEYVKHNTSYIDFILDSLIEIDREIKVLDVKIQQLELRLRISKDVVEAEYE
jgi:hypothetical protein